MGGQRRYSKSIYWRGDRRKREVVNNRTDEGREERRARRRKRSGWWEKREAREADRVSTTWKEDEQRGKMETQPR